MEGGLSELCDYVDKYNADLPEVDLSVFEFDDIVTVDNGDRFFEEPEISVVKSARYPSYENNPIETVVEYETCILTNVFSPKECEELVKDDFLSKGSDIEPIVHGEYNIGPRVYDCRLKLLDDLFVVSEWAGKDNLLKYDVEPGAVANYSDEEYLRYSRYLRKCYSLNNRATKIALCDGPMTTAHKFELCENIPSKSAVLFGFAHDKHHGFRVVNGVRVCYDTEAVEKGKVKKGSILDWRSLVKESDDLIVSDVSVGRKKEMGFFGSAELLRVYSDMYEMGKHLVYKSDVRDKPVGRLVGFKKQRAHNMEIIYYVAKTGGVEVKLPEFDVGMANAERNDLIIDNICPPYMGEVFPTKKRLKASLKCWPGPSGCKELNRFNKLTPPNNYSYEQLCMDAKLMFENFDCEPLNPGIEPPYAFVDLECTGADPFAFFFGLMNYHNDAGNTVDFDDEIGYYVN